MKFFTDRKPYQRIILCALAAMAVIFFAWTLINNAQPGILFKNVLMKLESDGVYSGKLYGTAVTVACGEAHGAKLVDISACGQNLSCRVEYPEGSVKTDSGKEVPRILILCNDDVLFSGGYDPDPLFVGREYFGENGDHVSLSAYHAEISREGKEPLEFSAANILFFAGEPEIAVRGNWANYLVAVFISVIGAVAIAFPDELFYLRHFLHVQDPEPTELYYTVHKLSSILFAVIVFVLFLYSATAITPL